VEVSAIAKDTGISPQKMRSLSDLVRGKKVDEALSLLKFASSPAARTLLKVIKSASANADNNFQMSPSDLRIIKIYIDEARTMKRFQPQARGRASPILKRSSHIKVVVAEQEG